MSFHPPTPLTAASIAIPTCVTTITIGTSSHRSANGRHPFPVVDDAATCMDTDGGTAEQLDSCRWTNPTGSSSQECPGVVRWRSGAQTLFEHTNVRPRTPRRRKTKKQGGTRHTTGTIKKQTTPNGHTHATQRKSLAHPQAPNYGNRHHHPPTPTTVLQATQQPLYKKQTCRQQRRRPLPVHGTANIETQRAAPPRHRRPLTHARGTDTHRCQWPSGSHCPPRPTSPLRRAETAWSPRASTRA